MIADLKKVVTTWNESWFRSAEPSQIATVRICAGWIAAIHFVLMMVQGSEWLGPSGWLDRDASYYLIGNEVAGTGSSYRWSLLYWYPETLVPFAGLGFLASLATAAGIGSRLSPLVVWLCLCTFGHRAPILTQLHEPLLVALFAYFVIDPGRTVWSLRPGLASGPPRVSVCIAMQLIRCHFGIWIAFSLASMLSHSIWWNGEAGWFLIQHSRGLLHLQDGWQWLGQLLTHLVIAVQFAILFCIPQSAFAYLGRWLVALFALVMLLLVADGMYAAVILAAGYAVWPLQYPIKSPNHLNS